MMPRPQAVDDPGRRVLGLDIGGANLKAATGDGQCASAPFALWLHPAQLADRLVAVARGLNPCSAWAVTMTGEMADVFLDRGAGVSALVEQTIRAAAAVDVDDVVFYSTAARFVSAEQAVEAPDAVASANWHALASWAAMSLDSPALLIDIGSTTTDIIPLQSGGLATESRTDWDRLGAGELVYLGGGRTPVCSLVQSLPFGGRDIPVMREVFATTGDCALALGLASEDSQDRATSDGAPRSVPAAVNRLARMIGLDHRRVDRDAARLMASSVMAAAADIIAAAIARQPPCCRRQWLVSGHTAQYFLPLLAPNEAGLQITALADWIGPELTRVAPAYACAVLRQQYYGGAEMQPRALQGVQGESGRPPASAPVKMGASALRLIDSIAVVKVGGSLLARQDLAQKLRRWLSDQMRHRQVNLLIGGGAVIDSLRELDRIHRCDAAAMHWQCVRALRVTMELVAQWLPEATVIDSPAAFAQHCCQRPEGLFLIAPEAFYHPSNGDRLPCDWTTTSDSIAALLAQRLSAERLVLLKSCEIADPHNLAAAAAGGLVDPVLPGMVDASLIVELVSF